MLRDRKLPIGSTKADFSTNLMKAIDDGALTAQGVESWLLEVEGWLPAASDPMSVIQD